MSTPAGWYPNGEEWETWWDGAAWSDRHRRREPAAAETLPVEAEEPPEDADLETGDGRTKPLMEFTSHIAGKNARVYIWPDRVEWGRRGWMGTGAKAGLAVMTFGASYLATGVRRKHDIEVVPIRSISGVTLKRGRGLQTVLSVITSTTRIDMRIAHREAEQVRTTLMSLIDGSHASQGRGGIAITVQAPATVQPPGPPDITAQLTQLAGLRDVGVLTEAEFTAKKAEILARL